MDDGSMGSAVLLAWLLFGLNRGESNMNLGWTCFVLGAIPSLIVRITWVSNQEVV